MTIPHPASRLPAPASVSPALYSRDLLLTFSGDEYAAFLDSGGRQLRPRLARALELARLAPGMHVLDIGCGRGEITLHAARRGAAVTAIDFSADCLELTCRTLALAPPAVRPRVRLVRASAAALPVQDRSVHRVFFLDVAEHLQPWQLRQALAEIQRVLRPDGYAVIHTLPNRWALDVGYRLMRRLWPGLPAEPRSAYERQVHVSELDLLQLSGVLDQAGLHSRVWLENWTIAHARWGAGQRFADPLRDRAYPLLRRWWVRPMIGALMHTPLRLVLANDLFAIAWRQGFAAPAPVWPRGWWERLALRALTDLGFSSIMYGVALCPKELPAMACAAPLSSGEARSSSVPRNTRRFGPGRQVSTVNALGVAHFNVEIVGNSLGNRRPVVVDNPPAISNIS